MKKYYLIETDSWSYETMISEFNNREDAVEMLQQKYVAAVLDHEEYDDDETFINHEDDNYAQWSNGYRTLTFRLAEITISPPLSLDKR